MKMKYLARLWLSDNKYMALLDEAIVIVTTDDTGKDVRWCIFPGHLGDLAWDEVKTALHKMEVEK